MITSGNNANRIKYVIENPNLLLHERPQNKSTVNFNEKLDHYHCHRSDPHKIVFVETKLVESIRGFLIHLVIAKSAPHSSI